MSRSATLARTTSETDISLELQPKFLLQKAYRDNKGKWRRAIIYKADFKYKQDGQWIVEDVKGYRTKVYRLKVKTLLAKWPDLDFREI